MSIAEKLREAELKASKPNLLPDGIIWPTFEDGELVRFGDEFTDRDGVTEKVTGFFFCEDKVFVNPSDRYSYGETVKRPEPEVPDTQEAIDTDAMLLVSESFFDQRRDEFEDRVFDLLRRQRKLLGGGQ